MSRATFHSQYATPASQRSGNQTRPRLGDCIHLIVNSDNEITYLAPADKNELCVLDYVTKEKAFIESPSGYSAADMQTMIESHFGAAALRVTEKLWLV